MAKKERELPEVLEIPFVICDNTLNRKGWRLLVEGIDTTGFLSNPVCCVQHDTWQAPVGKWKDLKVENGKFTGVVEFDRNDDEAVKLFWKYKDGYMNAVSLHVIPLTQSEEPSMLLPGQKYSTVVTSELLEVSLVTVPGQKNAVKLCTPDGQDFSLGLITDKQNPKTEMDGKEKEQNENREKELKELKEQLAAQRKLNAKNLIKLHQQRGVVQDGEVEHLTKLAETDQETVEKMLDARQPQEAKESKEQKTTTTVTDEQGKKLAEDMKKFTQTAGGGKSATEREAWTFLDWFKKDSDGLALMAKNEPDKHKALELAFAAEAKKNNLVAGE
jgi:hypothetical protein